MNSRSIEFTVEKSLSALNWGSNISSISTGESVNTGGINVFGNKILDRMVPQFGRRCRERVYFEILFRKPTLLEFCQLCWTSA
jgi:hypothetical protein